MKFLPFKLGPNQNLDLSDKSKWYSKDGKSFKAIGGDLQQDKLYATAEISEVKAVNVGEKLWIAGLANANIVDRMVERLDPRGLIVSDYMKNRQLLAHHSYHHPIGQVEELDIQEDGVHFRAWIGDPARAELTDMQKEIRSLVSQGILRTVSVGFIPKKIRAPLYNNDGTTAEAAVIESWELLELSVVAIPCNQDSVFEIRSGESINNSGGNDVGIKAAKTVETTEAAEATDTKQDVLGEEMVTLLRTIAGQMQRQGEVMDLILAKMDKEDAGEESDEGGETPAPQQDAAKSTEESTEAQSVQVNTDNDGDRIAAIEETVKGMNSKFDLLCKSVKLLASHITK